MKLARLLRMTMATLAGSFYGCSLLVSPSELDEGCDSELKACAGKCVARDDPEHGCADATCRPCVVANATAHCSAEGVCAVAACQGKFADCNGDGDAPTTDGCEVDTGHDPLHCGSCQAVPCRSDNGEAGCSGGKCSIAGCSPRFRDCNFAAVDGCEVALASDPKHCGDCEISCGKSQRCVEGSCQDAD